MAEITAAFVLGLLGSAHCIGMCGPFAVGIGAMAGQSGGRFRALTSYFGGKTLTYTLLGLVAGSVGAVLGSALSEFRMTFSVGIGVLLILTGVALFGYGRWSFPAHGVLGRLSASMGRLMRSRTVTAMFGLGVLNGLIPCGLVYGALVLAISSAGPVTGALVMAAFGVATVPALTLVGWSSGLLERTRLRRYLPQAGAVLVILMGVFAILRATPLFEMDAHHGAAHPETEQTDGAGHHPN